MVDKDEAPEDTYETSDSVEGSTEVLQPDSEDREASLVNWDTDTSVVYLHAEASGSAIGNDLSSYLQEVDKSSSMMDDSSSMCSTDSAPSLVINGSYKANSSMNNKSQKSPTKGKSQQAKASYREASGSNGADSLIDEPAIDLRQHHQTSSDKVAESIEYEAALSSSQEPVKPLEQTMAKKEDEISPVQGTPSKQ